VQLFAEQNPSFKWSPRFKAFDKNCQLDELPEAHALFCSYVTTIPTPDGVLDPAAQLPSNVTFFLVDLRNDGPFKMSLLQGPERTVKFQMLIAQVRQQSGRYS
jgi:hypothetical protein